MFITIPLLTFSSSIVFFTHSLLFQKNVIYNRCNIYPQFSLLVLFFGSHKKFDVQSCVTLLADAQNTLIIFSTFA